uniref:Uncharacterized protein LOC102807005 n=1 Tax=Saccoglossus kowalevskii TaxID=10224 RepID=A0ABM0LXM1_SACKO|nr:PREDICTED: uncharacterized protein LOC102807005 [Saccoglossus kowalevskii]
MSTVDESNCSLVPLSVKDLVQDMTPYGLAILVIESLIVLVSLIIYFEAYFFIKTILAREPTGRKSVFVLGLYPVFITLSYMSVLIPRTSTVTMPAASMYLSVVLHRLISIQADYFGGRRNYIEIITGQEVSLASFPFCICPCLPVMTMDAKHVKIIECGIMQHAVLRPLFYYIILIIESATYIYPTKNEDVQCNRSQPPVTVRGKCGRAPAVIHLACVTGTVHATATVLPIFSEDDVLCHSRLGDGHCISRSSFVGTANGRAKRQTFPNSKFFHRPGLTQSSINKRINPWTTDMLIRNAANVDLLNDVEDTSKNCILIHEENYDDRNVSDLRLPEKTTPLFERNGRVPVNLSHVVCFTLPGSTDDAYTSSTEKRTSHVSPGDCNADQGDVRSPDDLDGISTSFTACQDSGRGKHTKAVNKRTNCSYEPSFFTERNVRDSLGDAAEIRQKRPNLRSDLYYESEFADILVENNEDLTDNDRALLKVNPLINPLWDPSLELACLATALKEKRRLARKRKSDELVGKCGFKNIPMLETVHEHEEYDGEEESERVEMGKDEVGESLGESELGSGEGEDEEGEEGQHENSSI